MALGLAVAGAVAGWRYEGEGDNPAGLPRRLCAGLFPLLRKVSPLLFEDPPNAINAPSRAALLLAVDGAREAVLCECERSMPQRAALRGREESCEHFIQCKRIGVECCRAHIPASYGGFARLESDRDHASALATGLTNKS